MTTRVVLGLCGAIGSGKSTAAAYLRTLGFEEFIFADAIKKIGLAFGFAPSALYGTQAQKTEIHPLWGISGRDFMQRFGTEICRDVLPQVIPEMHSPWIRLLAWQTRGQPRVVISDVRFPDEAALVRKHGGYLVSLRRTPTRGPKSFLASALPEHISETQIVTPHYIVNNTGTLQALNQALQYIIRLGTREQVHLILQLWLACFPLVLIELVMEYQEPHEFLITA